MTTATEAYYRVRPDDDRYTQRVIAETPEGVGIVGAYRPIDLNDWRVFVAKPVADALNLPQPHKVHACSREDALRWIDLIATLYTKAAS